MDADLIYWCITAVAGAIFFMAAGNTVTMLASQALLRQPEFLVRKALGASPLHLLRLCLLEGVLLAVISGVVAVMIENGVLRAVAISLPRIYLDVESAMLGTMPMVGVSVPALSFSTALFAGTLIGVVQWRSLQGVGTQRLTSAFDTPRRQNVRLAVLGVQISVSLALILSAVPLIRIALRDLTMDGGYSVTSVLAIDFETATHGTDRESARHAIEQREKIRARVVARMSEFPDVVDIAAADSVPLFPVGTWLRVRDGSGNRSPFRWVYRVHSSAGLLNVLSIPIVAGRTFTEADTEPTPRVALVSKGLAESLWGSQQPLGRVLALQRPEEQDLPARWLEVVGVIGDIVAASGEIASPPTVYLPNPPYFSTLIVKLRSLEPGSAEALRKAVTSVDPTIVVTKARSIEGEVKRARYPRNTALVVLSLAAGFGFCLAAAGLVGIVTATVVARTREIGIRMALGAGRAQIVRLVLTECAVVSMAGIGIGVLLSWAALGAVRAVVTLDVEGSPQLTVGITVAVSTLILLAGYLPARRAMRLDPSVILRES